MYTREIQAPRDSPVENGAPLTGTWTKAFARVDLLGIHRPYPWPLPRRIKDLRLKEWESFSVQNEEVFLEALLGNFKLYQMAGVFLHNKKTDESYFFRKIVLGNSWRFPDNLYHASVECHTSRFLFRIHTWLDADTITLDLDIAATKRQPAFTARLAFCLADYAATPLAVSLNFDDRRAMYAFKTLAAVRGDLVLGRHHISLDSAHSTGIFRDYKGFFPYRMKGVFCGGMGYDGEGRRYGFHLVENQARETRKNNENALWADGRLTPLPPVRITMPHAPSLEGGPESDWVIQDLDGMVDLAFTPKEIKRFGANNLITSSDFFASMGYYNGMLVDSEGRQIQMHNQWGIGEKVYLRV